MLCFVNSWLLSTLLCCSNADDVVLKGDEHVELPTGPPSSSQQLTLSWQPTSCTQAVSNDGPCVRRPSSLPIPTDPSGATVTVAFSKNLEISSSTIVTPPGEMA